MKNLLLFTLAVSFSLPALSCSMSSYGPDNYSVTCAQINGIEMEESGNNMMINIRSENIVTRGGLDTSCEWDEVHFKTNDFFPVALLDRESAEALKTKLLNYKKLHKRICIFADLTMRSEVFMVTSSKETKNVRKKALKKFVGQ